MRRVEVPPDDAERARKLLAASRLVERKPPGRSLLRWLPLLVAVGLVLAIVLVLLINREQFRAVWGRLLRPGALPG